MSTKVELLRYRFNSPEVLSVTNGIPIKGYLLPSTDAHQNEYLSDYDFRVKFLTGFTGSNAYVAVTNEKAVLWTDGRYFTQALEQLTPPFQLLKQSHAESISVEDFIAGELCVGDWPIIMLPEEHGCCVRDKLAKLREKIGIKKCTSIVLAALDDIMWLLNIRGFDIKHNPLAYSYLLVTETEVHLFMDKADDKMRNYLERESVTLHPYVEAYEFISKWNGRQLAENPTQHKVFVPTSTNYLFGKLFSSCSVVESSPVQLMKGVKNPVEIEGMRQSHIRDSATLISFFMWMEKELLEGHMYTEIEMAAKVDLLRANTDKYVDLSFTTISAAGDHAAKPHYHSIGEEGNRLVTTDQVYLLDSGAHYRDGTTDVTRTIWLAKNAAVPDDFIKHNTLVLKGHITLASSVFPQAIAEYDTPILMLIMINNKQCIHFAVKIDNNLLKEKTLLQSFLLCIRLDTLSRYALWQAGLDFGHGTGHGVGHFLNVHEGPVTVGYRNVANGSDCWVREGMVLTIEPGYYHVGKWGIRIENCYEVVKAKVPSGADFLKFRALTLVPIQTSIIDKSLLSEKEVDWLNSYHDQIFSIVGEYLKKCNKTDELQWLRKQCTHI
ncbi:peptidase, M24 family [Dictyocaulus viviparus]|uniref:Peptidase, M24 family n=1 Tax=Dictyocaulus viviparus TaxID=29172 RepID=A0A0D8XTU1_DICVI|nr:peptidase, M24 family [Dictyocaulus viviparus]